MSSRKNKPTFNKKDLYEVKGFHGRNFELQKDTWQEHILKDRSRWHLKGQFEKIVETLRYPDYVLQSPKEQYVASYVKEFDDLKILDNIKKRAFIYVLVNLNNNNIRTVYDSPNLKGWKRLWPKK